jgi:cell division protein FtsN
MKVLGNLNSRQAGGTLLGLIIGLIVGLAIAVGVALMITKSSSPFTNKFGKSDKPDQPTTQLQDPNKPLYGNKDATKEAAKDFAKESNQPKPVDVVDAKPAESKPAESKPEVKVAPPAVDKVAPTVAPKLADKVEAKPAEANKPEAIDDKWIYYLQTGAFRDQSDAESARAKLALIGFEGRISERSSDSGNLYRVRIGPFAQIETLNRMRSRLSENGVDATVIRTPK